MVNGAVDPLVGLAVLYEVCRVEGPPDDSPVYESLLKRAHESLSVDLGRRMAELDARTREHT